MPNYNPQANIGSFVPTTNVWDVARIYEIDVNSDEFRELIIKLYQNINEIALSLNTRDAGYYVQNEFINGQLLFPNPANINSQSQSELQFRQVFRTTVDFGALPNATNKSVAHNIPVTASYTFTRIYGAASISNTQYIPLPYASSTGTANIQLDVTPTDVVITTTSNYSAYTTTYIILEYVKE